MRYAYVMAAALLVVSCSDTKSEKDVDASDPVVDTTVDQADGDAAEPAGDMPAEGVTDAAPDETPPDAADAAEDAAPPDETVAEDVAAEDPPAEAGDPPVEEVEEVELPPAVEGSVYLALSADRAVSGRTTILVARVQTAAPETLLVHSDGRYAPGAGAPVAKVFIEVDAAAASNESLIDWSISTNARPHSFNAVGVAAVGAGTHTVALVAEPVAGSFTVGAGTNLSVMAGPAASATAVVLDPDSPEFSFTTMGIAPPSPLPHTRLLSRTATYAGEDVVALASGHSMRGTAYGAAMWGLYLDGANTGNDASSWTVNDLWVGAETTAPMFCHGFFEALTGSKIISLDTSEFPWEDAENTAHYIVGAGTRLVLLSGGMTVRGAASVTSELNNPTDYVGIGSSTGWPGFPPVGTDVRIADASFDVPVGHDGVVMFVAKTRVQGDFSDAGGTTSLWIVLDGTRVGSTGFQELRSPNAVSQRTLSASFLATGTDALAPGTHQVELYGRADGAFKHLLMTLDLPLVWFD